ncbi:MAG: molybdopterin-dependent oxidoreductase [Rhodospirillales bacterium]|jgi:biotin/methionine sulfoxide reductase|nr:Asp-tRNA(Asn)/Glu-tRNA(Gln) amidotransferase GatCAB subunit C [Rhodospirillaceae bacterium]MDP6429191.1 molybdopterin-dependent oxidoreductase [Rhodospirillales bacterium]MDP6644094.1 molybdopterin-dependent oxidoreductase [Rhodospirillales bacterium]MDP6841146.1 molybdopterin-dependent oxidoreductase [Rhodospirillales bacterium]
MNEKSNSAPPDGSYLNGSHWGIFHAEARGGRVVGVRPFELDPHPTPLIEAIPSMVHNEARIEQPMVREGFRKNGWQSDTSGRGTDRFIPVSWDEAAALTAGELDRVRSEHGNASIFAGCEGWDSSGVFQRGKNQIQRLLNQIGGYTGKVLTYSTSAANIILPHVVGSSAPLTAPTTWPSIAQSAELFVGFGGLPAKNVQVDNGGGVHMYETWLRACREADVSFVNISPSRTDMPDYLDAEWLPVRPNSDTALMLALAYTLVAEGLHDETFLGQNCVGFDKFRPYLMGETDGQPKSAAWAEAITDIPAGAIETLARRMAGARTMINVTWSLQRADNGEQPFWMAIALAAILGQIGLPGCGVACGYGTTGGRGNPSRNLPVPSFQTGPNPIDSVIPVARIAEMLEGPGQEYDFNGAKCVYPDIRLVYWAGGNPFHHHQDLNRFLRAWQKPETIIVQDPFWTSTARRADIVLPATTQLERNDLGARRGHRFVFAMQQAVAPVGQARNDYEIVADIAGHLGLRDRFTEGRGDTDWLRHIYDLWRQGISRSGIETPDFESFWEQGYFEMPAPETPHILFEDFRADAAAHPLPTPSGKIEIFSDTIAGFGYAEIAGHPAWTEPVEWLGADAAATYPLHLLSNQPRWRLHSQGDAAEVSRGHKIQGREAAFISPADAEVRGIKDGDVVRIFNERGSCLAGAVVSENLRPGVVQLPTGAWFDPEDPATIGSLEVHGNPNALTRDAGTSRLAQGPVAQSALVEMQRFDLRPPAITAFTPPEPAAAR